MFRREPAAAQGLQVQGDAGNAGVAKGAVVDEASAGNDLEAAEGELLLQVDIIVQALAVGLRVR